jgi:hypothetical protein
MPAWPNSPSGTRAALIALLMLLATSRAGASDFFGPSEGLQLQPELDVIGDAGGGFRLIGKFEPTWTPSEANDSLGFSLYACWLVAPITGSGITPDIAKRRRLDVRVGISWYPTIAPGSAGWADLLRLEAEATTRTTVPGAILVTLRNRVQAQWGLDQAGSFVWRLRTRPQLEREFELSQEAGTSLTPFLNAEFIWTTSQDMWAQFRMQAGLQLAVHWFGQGQVIELNGSVVTYLQPARSYSPIIGAVWYQYF